jgi:hypothetical protein
VDNELKQQGDGAGETSRTTNYELHKKGWATRAPVAQTLRSVRQLSQFTTPTWQYQLLPLSMISQSNFSIMNFNRGQL